MADNYKDDDMNINDVGDNSDITDEFEQAYAADRERKNAREEELQAARDYVGVILEEAEGRSFELEGKKQEAEKLAERLSKTEDKVEELRAQTAKSDRQSKFLTFWMCFSLIELIIIAGLLVAFYFKLNLGDGKSVGIGDTVINPGTSVQTTPVPTAEPEPLTSLYCDDLELRVKYLSTDSIAPFSASIEKLDGLQYLVFTDGDIRVCYKNEYYNDELNYRKCILIENGVSRYTLQDNYDLAGDITELCPTHTVIGGKRMLAFIDYSGNIKTGIPEQLMLIGCDDFRMYRCTDLKDRVKNLMNVEALTEISCLEDAPFVYRLSTSKAVYNYAIPEIKYNEIMYNELEVPEVASNFDLTVDENGINWSTYVCLGDDLYMGKLTGSLITVESGLNISGAKFGAFVPANQEDAALGGYIRPATEIPARYMTITGNNNERYYIAVNENLRKCGYYWDNLNTDEPNNWIYYDADGNKASWRGIDVSKYQANVDWAKVAAEGIDFAIIRMGYRGMNEGTLELDNYFLKNIRGANDNNINAGIYFFSQAVTEAEAVEEAHFVINAIKDYKITYPVVFDTERVTTYAARANGLSMDERTRICRAFCDEIAKAGYKPMIYANTKYMTMGIDLSQLQDIDMWYAIYSSDITFPYGFEILQYSEKGSIPGVSGNVDLNISFVDYSKEQN